MKKLIILLCLLMASCGDGLDDKYVEPQLSEYVEKFRQLYNVPANIEIKFADLEIMIAGVCYSYGNSHEDNYIEIDRDYFDMYSNIEREELIFHELGHCIFNRDHTTERMMYKSYSVPISIMYPYMFGGSWFYEQNLTHYYDELVKGKK
jgi:hypothetical protein